MSDCHSTLTRGESDGWTVHGEPINVHRRLLIAQSGQTPGMSEIDMTESIRGSAIRTSQPIDCVLRDWSSSDSECGTRCEEGRLRESCPRGTIIEPLTSSSMLSEFNVYEPQAVSNIRILPSVKHIRSSTASQASMPCESETFCSENRTEKSSCRAALLYRTGFLMSSSHWELVQRPTISDQLKSQRITLMTDLGRDVELSQCFIPIAVPFHSTYKGKRQRKQRISMQIHQGSIHDDWVTGGDSPENDDANATKLVRNRNFSNNHSSFKEKTVCASSQNSTSDDTDEEERKNAPTEYEDSEHSELPNVGISNADRERIYDEWQINNESRSCGVVFHVDRLTNVCFNLQGNFSIEIYYKDVRRAKASVDGESGIVAAEHYLSVEDDSIPVVFLLVQKKLWWKVDRGIATVRLNSEQVERAKGVTLEGCYFERGAAKVPVVDPDSFSSRVGSLIISWHADMREAKGTEFCPSCGRLRIHDGDGSPMYCVCDDDRKKLHKEREERDRRYRDAALQDAKKKRLALYCDKDMAATSLNGTSGTIPVECDFPPPAEVDEIHKVNKPVKHTSCCLAM